MSVFTITVVDRPEIPCVGIKVATDMTKAKTDCPALWEAFGPRMSLIPTNPAFVDESFGASIMLDESNFDYWAVKPVAAAVDLPEGMAAFTLPAGKYAECVLNSLRELDEAYGYIYSEWPASQQEYVLDMKGVGLERYTSEFMDSGKLTIYCPLLKKASKK